MFKKLRKWVDYYDPLITLVIAIVTIWLTFSTLDLQYAVLRADMSLLIDPSYDQTWESIAEGNIFTINGTIINEGSRTAIIKEFELSLIYELPNNDWYELTLTHTKPDETFNWTDNLLAEEETRTFSVRMFVQAHLYVDENTGQIFQVGDKIPDQYEISVTFNDGKGEDNTIKKTYKTQNSN